MTTPVCALSHSLETCNGPLADLFGAFQNREFCGGQIDIFRAQRRNLTTTHAAENGESGDEHSRRAHGLDQFGGLIQISFFGRALNPQDFLREFSSITVKTNPVIATPNPKQDETPNSRMMRVVVGALLFRTISKISRRAFKANRAAAKIGPIEDPIAK